MQRECLLQLSVLRGIKLPSTDLLSKTDAYVKVKVNDGLIGQTLAKQDTNDPVWDRDFFLTLPLSNNRTPAGRVELELWDQDTFKDSLVATAVLDLSKLEPACLSYLELPLLFEKSKHATAGAHARLVVGVKGWVSAFGTLLADTQHIPGALFNPVNRRAYLPVPCPGLAPNSVYLGVEYEKDCVDVKLLVCTRAALLHADMFLLGRPVSKVRRRCFRDGLQVLPGLCVYEEVKMDDVPLTTDWRQLCLVVFDKSLIWCGDSDAVVSAHGWRGAMNFEGACSVLHGCDFDHQKREIYMPLATPTPTAPMQQQQQLPTGQQQQQMGLQASSSAGVYPGMMQQQQQQQYPPPQAPPPEALLLIDYDNTNVGLLLGCSPDVKLAVLDNNNPGGPVDKHWELSLQPGQNVNKTSQVFVPAQPRAGGKWRVSRVIELDDVAYGTAFTSIMLYK